MTEKKREKKDLLSNRALILIMIIGALIIAYPSFSDWWNSFHQTRAIASYVDAVANLNKEDYERMFAEAEAYNKTLIDKSDRYHLSEEEKKEYEKILDVTGTGIMGYVEIPKIHISYPIYHGTDEAVLQIAIGHIEGSSFPVGGIGTHSAISGHRGLPSARLFTDVDRLIEGDTFMIQILDRTITYEVDQIHTVLPEELDDLKIDPEKDYCTLITCSPYGINSHRLLIRGYRVDNAFDKTRVTADAVQLRPEIVAPIVAVPIVLVLLIGLLIKTGRKKKETNA